MDKLDTVVSISGWHGRRYRRFKLEYPVRIIIQSDALSAEVETISKNVSVGGLLVRSASAIPHRTPVTFVISLHGEEAIRPIHLVGEGEIVRVEPNGSEGVFAIAVHCKVPITQLAQFLPGEVM